MRTSTLLAFAALGLLVSTGSPVRAASTEIDPGRARELVRLVRQDCGSCHGLRLKGGLGPALLPENLRDKAEDSLRYTILLGRPGTAMPPWKGLLTEAEVDWVLARLKAGFPEEVNR